MLLHVQEGEGRWSLAMEEEERKEKLAVVHNLVSKKKMLIYTF